MAENPSVSILLPVRNEAADIDSCLDSLAVQDYPGHIQIVVADGESDDNTREIVDSFRDRLDIIVLENSARVQSVGLNQAAAAADGEILIRADGHAVYGTDYVGRNVASLLEADAIAVGGLMNPVGDNPLSRAVAAAMSTRLAIGPGRFHHATEPGPTDTVYLGAFRRIDFERLGSYRSFPSAVAEDADLYYRWRKAGQTVWLDPSIVSDYRPRRTWSGLWCQVYRWGKGKAEMWYTNHELPYLRPLIPTALVLALVGGLGLGMAASWIPVLIVVAAWGVVLAAGAVAGRHAGVAPVAAVMHFGYGIGVLIGLLKGRRRSLPSS